MYGKWLGIIYRYVITEDGIIPPSQVVSEDGLTKILLWNWHIIYPTTHHGEPPLYRQKENNFFEMKKFQNEDSYTAIVIKGLTNNMGGKIIIDIRHLLYLDYII